MIKRTAAEIKSLIDVESRPIDIAILTIREDEFRAVLNAFPSQREIFKGRRHYNLRAAEAGEGKTYRIAIVRQLEQGNGEAQDAARDIIEELHPKLLLVVGIAGGLPSDDFTLGDVIVSTRIHDYSLEARKEGETPTYSISGGPLAREIAAGVANLPAMDIELGEWAKDLGKRPRVDVKKLALYGPLHWQNLVREKLCSHFGASKNRLPIVTCGAIATSDRLVKDPNVLFPWIETARHILGVEMESGGVYRAARERTLMVAIRGISDIVGLKRDECWTKFACSSAAAFVRAYLRTTPVPPSDTGLETKSVQSDDTRSLQTNDCVGFEYTTLRAESRPSTLPQHASILVPYQAQGLFIVQHKKQHGQKKLHNSREGFHSLLEEFLALGCLRVAVPAHTLFGKLVPNGSDFNGRLISVDVHKSVYSRAVSLFSPVAEELGLKESDFESVTPVLPAQASAFINEKNPLRKKQIGMLSYVFEHTYSLLLGFEYGLQVSLSIPNLRHQTEALRDILRNPNARINLSSLLGLLRTYETWNVQTLVALNSSESSRSKLFDDLAGNEAFRHLSMQMHFLGMPSKNKEAAGRIAELTSEISQHFKSGIALKDRLINTSQGVIEPESELEHDAFVKGFLPPIVPLKGVIWSAYNRWRKGLPDKYESLSLHADGRETYFPKIPDMRIEASNKNETVMAPTEIVDGDDADFFATLFANKDKCPVHGQLPITKLDKINRLSVCFCCAAHEKEFWKHWELAR